MNNKPKVFLKEFLGFGILITVIFATLLFLLLSIRLPGELYNMVYLACYPLIAVVLYFFVKKLSLTSRRAVFYRVFFWMYLSIIILDSFVLLYLLSSVKGADAVLTAKDILMFVSGPLLPAIIYAGIISFLVFPPTRKSNGQTDETN